jgi:flagellin
VAPTFTGSAISTSTVVNNGAASSTVTLIGPRDGDTVTLGTKVYSFSGTAGTTTGATTYLGAASGDLATDASTLATAINTQIALLNGPANATSATSLAGVITVNTSATLSAVAKTNAGAVDTGAQNTATPVANLGLATATINNGTAAINAVNSAITKIGNTLSALGSATIQLKGLSDFTDQLSTSVTTSLGSLVDANLSQESAMLSSLQTKQSLAIQSLSLANQGPGALLQLFR